MGLTGQAEAITVEGRVIDLLFHNPGNLYTVFVLDTGREETAVVCEYPGLSVGEVLKVSGSFVYHPEYGRQIRASAIEQIRPVGQAAILDYLSGGAVKGIGPATAKRIVQQFGERAFEVIESEPEQLAQIKGISLSKARQIADNFALVNGVRRVIAFVAGHGLDSSVGIKCWKCWQSGAIELLTHNPYRLCDDSIGADFEVADRMAERMGIGADAACRVRAGILFVLRHNLQNGHACLPDDKLIPAVCGLLSLDTDIAEINCDALLFDKQLLEYEAGGRRYIYLPSQYLAEGYIAGRLRQMLTGVGSDTAPVSAGEITRLEGELGIKYSPQQQKALSIAFESPAFVLTGGPGTGKTTTLNGLLRLMNQRGYKPALAAPTGRAAKRMSEVTGSEAKTIHRLLEVDFSDSDSEIKFKRGVNNPLGCDVLIIDEMSMVDSLLFESVLKALRLGSRLIMVGDSDQLPSVGAGNLLSDIISSGQVPMVHLSEVFRQAAKSRIVMAAHGVVKGEGLNLSSVPDGDMFFMRRATAPDAAEAVVSLCSRRLPEKYGFSPIEDIQVISPTRQGGVGTIRLNELLQQELNPPAPGKVEVRQGGLILREGDKVMQVKNNYDVQWRRPGGEEGLGIYNGDIGIITMVDKPSRSMLIMFDDREVEYLFDNMGELELAYAITVHKSQGSEFDAVVMPLVGSHRHLHYRNLLYTAITRAKKLLVMVGHPATAQQMAANNRGNRRYTNLARRINGS